MVWTNPNVGLKM